jgi:hypothetical protein
MQPSSNLVVRNPPRAVRTDFAVFMGKLFLQARPGFVASEVLMGRLARGEAATGKSNVDDLGRVIHFALSVKPPFTAGATVVQLFQDKTRGRVPKLDPEAVEPVVVAILPNRADQKPE